MLNHILRGVAAGAAGTTALNAVTYLDMVLRGRGASSTPEESVRRLAAKAGVTVPGDEEKRSHRESGAGALLGMVTGVTVGAAYGAARAVGWRPSAPVAAVVTGLAAVAASSLPMASMGVSDPREWSLSDWLSDLIPHLAYGLTTATTYAAMTEDDS
jgi:hypothetical protein